jgi:hypothetical protein
MLSGRTTAWLFVAVGLAGGVVWMVYRHVPSDGGTPRPRLLLATPIDRLDNLLIETGGATLACQLRQGTWWLTRPIEARADDERIHRLLDTLALAPVHDIITPEEQRRHNASQHDYGLAPPRARLLLRGPSEPPVELRIGAQAAHGQSLYVGFTGSANVWVTEPALFAAFPTGIGDLRDRALLPYPASRLRRFELRAAGQPPVEAERDAAGAWWLRQPDVRRADNDAVAALLDYVTEANIETFVHSAATAADGPTAADPASLGIAYGCTPEDSPLIARFWFADGRPSFEYHELVFGKPCSEAPDQMYLLSTEEQLVVTVDSTVPHALRVSPDDLRDRRLWPFTTESVQRLRIRGETDAVTLERTPDAGWAITQPIQAPARSDASAALLEALLQLQDVSVAETEPPTRQDLLVELTTALPDGVHTALVTRVRDASELGVDGLDWYLPANRQTHRTDSVKLPQHFGQPPFFAALRDLNVLKVIPGTLAGIQQQLGTNAAFRAVQARDGGWTASEPVGAAVAMQVLAEIARTASELRATEVAALVPTSLDAYGLREPTCALTLELREPESSTRILLVGKTAPSGGRYAAVKGRDSVFVLSPETSALLLTPVLSVPPAP